MEKTHWKKLINPDYFGSYSLNENEERTVKIKEVIRQQVIGTDGKKTECTVAVLYNEKPLILNRTNCKMIARIYDTPYIENWKDKSIIVFSDKVKAFGDVVEAIRIKNEIPKNEINSELIETIRAEFNNSQTREELNAVYAKYKKYATFDWFIKIIKEKQNGLSKSN
jgi:hypothetical protein